MHKNTHGVLCRSDEQILATFVAYYKDLYGARPLCNTGQIEKYLLDSSIPDGGEADRRTRWPPNPPAPGPAET